VLADHRTERAGLFDQRFVDLIVHGGWLLSSALRFVRRVVRLVQGSTALATLALRSSIQLTSRARIEACGDDVHAQGEVTKAQSLGLLARRAAFS
jgi:hypothetical protein